MEHFASVHDLDCPWPHWYLLILGVEPDAQGQGMGGSLIAPILRRADDEGTPCFLNTHKPSNVAFYQRYGFTVVREEAVPGRVPQLLNIRRQPQRNRS
jgi:ribosomal protein S18 acetylase RimI-like enzyme